ncbi:unnamed protein product [Closterium sp. NIES-53]
MATPRVLCFDAEGRPLEFSVWLLRARCLLESQVQAHETLWAHTSGDLPEPADPAPLAADPTPTDSDRYERKRADVTAWKSRDAAACIALSSLLSESEETHSLSYRAACTDAQLALLPPPMAITIYFIATSLPDRLASVRDALLLKHPRDLTIEVLKDVESNLRSVAFASGVVPPPLFHGWTVPHLPTFTASLATAATDVTAAAVTTSSRSRGRSGRRGGQGAGRGGGGGGGDVASGGGGSACAGGAPRVAAGYSPAAAGGGDARVRQPPTGLPAAGGARRSQPCGRSHPPGQYFAQLTDTVRLAYGIDGPAPDWLPLVQIYGPALWGMSASQLVDLLGTPHAMYVVVDSSAFDSVYSSVVSLGASLAEDSGASHYFFRDRTALTPLPTPVSVALVDPSSGPDTARYTTTLPCPAVPSGSLTGFHVPLAVAAATAAAVAAATAPNPCHCPPSGSRFLRRAPANRLPTPLFCGTTGWDTRPFLACALCLVLGLPRVLPSLPPSLAPPCSPCVEGRLRTTPHSSSLRLATEPFETLHLDVWGPASRPGPGRESFFLVGVDDYSRYTTVFPLAKKSDVTSTLIRWLLTTADTRGHRVSCLHSDRGGEFRSSILAGFCREHGIRQTWTLPESPQQNRVAERRIGLVMEIARTSMTHARAPHFLWPYAVWYAAHELNLWPCVSRPEVSPTSLWTGTRLTTPFTTPPPPPSLHWFSDSCDVRFDESVPYYVRYPCQGLPVPPAPLFLTLAPPPAPLVQPPPLDPAPSSVSHATPPPLVAPQVQPPSPQPSSQPTADPARAGFRGEDPRGASSRSSGVGAESVPVRGPGSGGAGVGAEPVTAGKSSLRGAGVSGAVPGGATTGGAPSAGPGEPGTEPVTSGGAGSRGGASGYLESGPGATTAPDTTPPPHPCPTWHQARVRCACEEQLELEQEERELERQQLELQRLEEQQQQQQPEQEQPQQPPQQQQQQPPPPPVSGLRTLGLPSPSPPSPPSPPVSGPPLPPPDASPAVFPPPLPTLSPPLSHTWPSRRSPRARPSSPVPFTDLCTTLFCSSPPRLSPSVLPSPPKSALTTSLSTLVTNYYSTHRLVLSCALTSLITDPRASLSSVSALTAAVTEFASTRCLDYATSLVAAPPTSPLAVRGEPALGCDALEDMQFELEFLAAASPHLCAVPLAPEGNPDALDIPTPRTYAEAVSGPWASQWRAAMDSEMASYRSTGTYVNEVPPLETNVVDGMWIFRVKRPPGSPPVFKAHYVARGFSQREGVDFFQTFAPTPKMTTLRVLLHVEALRDYELHSLDFSTAFFQGSLHEEVWLRRPSAFSGTFPPGTQWRLRRPVYSLRQAPREWHDTLCSTLFDLGFQPSSADP